MLGTINLNNSLASEVKNIRKESTSATLKTSIIPYGILNLIFMPKDKCSYHPFSKKLLFAPNVYGHRKPKLDTT